MSLAIKNTRPEKSFQYNPFLWQGGLLLIALALLTPGTSDHQGHNFLELAIKPRGEHFNQWVSAWCSLKAMVLSFGLGLLLLSGLEISIGGNRNLLSQLFTVLIGVVAVGFLAFAICLVSALIS